MLGKITAIVNQKGGVGKTTTAVSLASAMGLAKKKTLLIDVDPQGNATSGFGINKKEVSISSYHVLIQENKAEDAVLQTTFKNVDIIPSTIDLVAAELELAEVEDREYILKNALTDLKEQYDYIFMDCPPSLSLITINALSAGDSLIVPIQCEYYAMEGLSQLMATVRQIKRLYNPDLELDGVLLTMYDRRLNLTGQVKAEVENFLPGKIFKSIIPRAVRLSEAPSFGKPIQYYDKRSKGAKAYDSLAKEIIRINKK